jgi:S-adenosylmethionine:tRNA-ribosyltransferase-isomerase (queuine synthetase)
MDFRELYNSHFLQFSKIVEYVVILLILSILYSKIPKSKKLKVEMPLKTTDNKEFSNIIDSMNEIKLITHNHSFVIHNLQSENYELRAKLDKIYSNNLNENINYYKSILSMSEKIEYMQKIVFKTSELNDKFDRLSQYVDSRIRNV